MARAMVRFGAPAEALRPYVSTYYIVERAPADDRVIEDLLHPEWANLRLVLAGRWSVEADGRRYDPADDPRLDATLYGPTSRTMRIRSSAGVGVGAGLLPTGCARLLPCAAGEIADRILPQEEVFERTAVLALLAELKATGEDAARFAALDAFLLNVLWRSDPEPPFVARAHALLMAEKAMSVERFAAELGLSERQLHRLCVRYFGFPPKLLLRRQRFLRTLAMQRDDLDRPWGSLIDPSYYDQAQYIRDFHDFMGMTPGTYFALPRLLLEPAARARVDMFGQPFQSLHAVQALPRAEPNCKMFDMQGMWFGRQETHVVARGYAARKRMFWAAMSQTCAFPKSPPPPEAQARPGPFQRPRR